MLCKCLGGPVGIMLCDGQCDKAEGVRCDLPVSVLAKKPVRPDERINEWCLNRCERLTLTIARDCELIETDEI